MDFQEFLKKLPPFTKYYLGATFLVTFLISYPIFKVINYLVLDYDLAIFSFQFWRLFTNFAIVGKFSMNFLFFMILMYQQLSKVESHAITLTRYGEFVMMILYFVLFILVLNFLVNDSVYLSMELLFAFMYIDSKREPEKLVSLWGFVMKSKY